MDSEILRIPFVEHPRNVKDLIKVYNIINGIVPSMQLTDFMAIKSYVAAKSIQRLRRSVLSGQTEHLPVHMKRAFAIFRPILCDIWARSDKFYVHYFEFVTLEKSALAFKTLHISDL
jgi:hypothetical protein